MVVQTIQSFTKNRPYDHVYDPIHTVSSHVDHHKAHYQARTRGDKLVRVPVFENFTSELAQKPRLQVQVQSVDPLPAHINRQWPGYRNQALERMELYKKFNYAPDLRVPVRAFDHVDVSGKYRANYFKRPLIPFLQQLSPEWVLSGVGKDLQQFAGVEVGHEVRSETPFQRSTHTQTDYRDSETQTDPYSPEFVIRPGEQPELLTLATLSWGRGLPAGVAEVEMIERARAKRAWEARLPPLNDPSQWEKRRRMMDAMELQEWSLREKEIEKLQGQRLEVLINLLQRREDKNEQLRVKRLQATWSKKQLHNQQHKKKLQHEYIRCLRKLNAKRKKVEGKFDRRDIVREYSDPGSQTFAPLTRIGFFADKNSDRYKVKGRLVDTYHGLLELESWLPLSALKPNFKAPRPRSITKDGYLRRRHQLEKMLADTYENIQDEKKPHSAGDRPLRYLERIEKPPPRPPTPSVPIPNQREDDRELAIVYLQQFLRGRAVQNMIKEGTRLRSDMIDELRSTLGLLSTARELGVSHDQVMKMIIEGKQKRSELITELRSTHALQRAGMEQKMVEREETKNLQKQRKLFEHKEAVVDSALSELEGDVLSSMFDYLSKELIRLQEERKIHAFAMLAERQRRIREAEESGRRQLEERRRREQDEAFKQVLKIHQATVDQYLESVVGDTVAWVSERDAQKTIQAQAEQIDQIAHELEEKRDEVMSEEIVSDLVHNFLLPEVRKQTVRQKVKREQRKLLVAAHKEILRTNEKAVEGNSAPVAYPPYLTELWEQERVRKELEEAEKTHLEALARAEAEAAKLAKQTDEIEVEATEQVDLVKEDEREEKTEKAVEAEGEAKEKAEGEAEEEAEGEAKDAREDDDVEKGTPPEETADETTRPVRQVSPTHKEPVE